MKLTDVTTFNDQSRREEAANGISHGIGSCLSIGGTAVLIVLSALKGSGVSIICAAIYGASLILLFTMSTLYHLIKNMKVKKVFQILDHSSVYILILGTYTPICLSLLKTTAAYYVWGFVLLMTIAGVALNIVNLKKFHLLSMVLYLLMGWSAMFILKQMLDILSVGALIFLLGGGVAYSIGVLFYLIKGPKYMHFIWHLFVLAGAVLHYFFILLNAISI